jgi:uncharacterized protein
MAKTYRDQDWISSKVEIRPSAIHGKGMFAVTALVRDEVVVVWGGTFVGRDDAEKARLAGKAVQQIEEGVFEVFDRDQPGPSYYHNHSCEPNTGMEDEVTIVALRTIRPGEELTVDYAMFEANEDCVMPWECRCGAPKCRKRITGRDWRSRELQARYGRHFSPILLRRIAQEQGHLR